MESILTVISGAAQTGTSVGGERFAPATIWGGIRLMKASGDLRGPDSNLAITAVRLGRLGPTQSVRVRRTDSLNPQPRPFPAHDFQATFVPLLAPHVRTSIPDNGLIVREKTGSNTLVYAFFMESILTVISSASQTGTSVGGERFAPSTIWGGIRLMKASGDFRGPDPNPETREKQSRYRSPENPTSNEAGGP